MVPGANRHEVDKLDAILAENAPYTHPTKTKELHDVTQPLDFTGADGESRTPDLLITNFKCYQAQPVDLMQ